MQLAANARCANSQHTPAEALTTLNKWESRSNLQVRLHLVRGTLFDCRTFAARGLSRWRRCLPRLQAVVARSGVVEDGTIVTAVVRSSEKVGGPRTQFLIPEPLARSGHQRTRLRRS